jgi:hypothetical protein
MATKSNGGNHIVHYSIHYSINVKPKNLSLDSSVWLVESFSLHRDRQFFSVTGACVSLPHFCASSAFHGNYFSWRLLLMELTSHGAYFSWSLLLMELTSHGAYFSWSLLLMELTIHGAYFSWRLLLLARSCVEDNCCGITYPFRTLVCSETEQKILMRL